MLYRTTLLTSRQRGLRYIEGKFEAYLEPGRHSEFLPGEGDRIDVLDIGDGVLAYTTELDRALPAADAKRLDVPTDALALITRDGLPDRVLTSGRYLVWTVDSKVQIQVLRGGDLTVIIPDGFRSMLPAGYVRFVELQPRQIAIVVRDGVRAAVLKSGKHALWVHECSVQTEIRDLGDFAQRVSEWTADLDAIVDGADALRLEVPAESLALITRDGVAERVLTGGRYMLWTVDSRVTVQLVTTAALTVEIPDLFRNLVPGTHVRWLKLSPWETGLVQADGALAATLSGGQHALWVYNRTVSVDLMDLREQELVITGQEVMSKDKVSLRVNLRVGFVITQPEQALQAVTSLRDALYAAAQLSARRVIAAHTLDELLKDRNGASEQMVAMLIERASTWGVEVRSLDLKDLILPGEMKVLLNRVIEAEKTALANVILRREETAATRSMANTAKLMEKNPTLMRLREMDALKEIAAQVGEVTIVAAPEQLMRWPNGLLKG